MAAATRSEKANFSLPLYLSGLAVTMCGVLTVTYTIENASFTTQTVLLTLAGFAFSLGCRALRINARVIEWLCLGLIALAVYGTLSGRIDWVALMPMGTDKNETKLAVLLCWAATLRAWVLFSDDAVLSTPLIVIAAIGLVSSFDLNTPVAVYFCGCVVATTFLLIHYHSLRQRALATPQERARERRGLVPAQVGLAVLCGLAVLGLACVLIVPLEAVSKNLSLAGAIRQLAKLGAPANPGNAATRFFDEPTLLVGTGDGWSASPQVLLHVAPEDGQPHLWRGRTYDRYAGAGWISTQEDLAPRPVIQPSAEDDPSRTFILPVPRDGERPLLTSTFDVIGDTDEFYYAAEPRRLMLDSGAGPEPSQGLDGLLDLGGRSLLGSHYRVMSLLAPDPDDPAVQARLRWAGTNYPAEVRRLYLGNMGGEDSRTLSPQAASFYTDAVWKALHGLPADRRTPIDEALAIRDWVADRATYSLVAPAIPEGRDRVFEFLAHTRRGYCDLFASSMTVLCRIAGLPARLATGFAPGEQDGREYNLRALDKHAWTEVYFPGAGWLAFDPTAGSRTDGSIPSPSPPHRWDWPRVLRRLGAAPLALGGVILMLLLYVAKAEWYDRWRARRVGARAARPSGRPLRSEAGPQYARMARILGAVGLPRDPSETPRAYAARVQEFLAEQGPGAPDSATVAALTGQFIAARYGGAGAASEAQVQAGERALRRFAVAAARLRGRQMWKRLRRGRSVP